MEEERTLKIPRRMREQHPEAFKPKAIVFYPLPTGYDQSEWTHSFHSKAAAVYSACWGKEAENMETAETFFKNLAKDCSEKVVSGEEQQSADVTKQKAPPATAAVQRTTSKQVQQPETSKTSIPDMSPEKLPGKIKTTCDAIYLVACFLSDLTFLIERDRGTIDASMTAKHGTQVVSDIAMLDNQVPMPYLRCVVENLNPVLESSPPGPAGSKPNLKLDRFKLVPAFCRYFSPFDTSNTDFSRRLQEVLYNKDSLLDCLQHSLQKAKTEKLTTPSKVSWPIPTAKELARAGIGFEAAKSGAVSDVQFANTVLTLPVLVLDSKIETVVRNVVELETSKTRRPMSRYLQLLYEMVEDVGDVRVLKKCGILRLTGRWRSDEEVVSFVKGVGRFASFPSMFPDVDAQVEKMRTYYNQRKDKFWVRYGPTLKLASSVVAAVSVVATTVYAVRRRKK